MTKHQHTSRLGGLREYGRRERRRGSSGRDPVASSTPNGLESLESRLLMSVDPGPFASLWSTDVGGNGNWYEVVAAPDGISWQDAHAAAVGRGGHLVTITSVLENDFVFSLADDSVYWNELPVLGVYSLGPWIGAYRPEGTTSDPTEDWQWVTGETWDFTNWASVEPDRTDENYAHYTGRGVVTDDTWANWVSNHGLFPIVSYVIEWEASDVGPSNEAPAIDSTPITNALEGEAYSYTISATDPDGDALQFSAAGLPDWLTLTDNGDGTATLAGTPDSAAVGSHTLSISVTDGDATVEQTFDLVVDALAQINGTAFRDTNGNGALDSGEATLVGWTAYLDANGNGQFDDGERATLTDDNGRYEFTGLTPGEYNVGVVAPVAGPTLDGFQIHCSWRDTYLDLEEGENVRRTDLDDHTYLLGFEDWIDNDFNDLILKVTELDGGEMTLEVFDRNAAGHFDLVDHDGDVVMRRLGEKKYTPVGTQMQLGQSWYFTTGAVQSVTVGVNDAATLDFGAVHAERSDISGVLWDDANRDGVRDESEGAIDGWRVYVDANDNGQYDDGERFDVTGEDGAYRIEDLLPGQYAVRSESLMEGLTLDDLQIHCSWRGTYLDLMEGSMVRRTDLGDGSYLLGFEDWIDRDFNDLVLRVQEGDNGAVTITVHGRRAAGHFDLVERDGDTLMQRLAERSGAPIGTSFTLGEQWESTTGVNGLHMVDVLMGEDATQDMGMARAEPEPPAPAPMASQQPGNSSNENEQFSPNVAAQGVLAGVVQRQQAHFGAMSGMRAARMARLMQFRTPLQGLRSLLNSGDDGDARVL